MIIRVEICSLNEDQENLDNSWLLGENNIANASIELAKTNGDQNITNIANKSFDIIVENNQIFIAHNQLIEDITINNEKQISFSNFIIKTKIVDNQLQVNESLTEYFNPRKNIVTQFLNNEMSSLHDNNNMSTQRLLTEQSLMPNEYINWYSPIKDYEIEEIKLSPEEMDVF